VAKAVLPCTIFSWPQAKTSGWLAWDHSVNAYNLGCGGHVAHPHVNVLFGRCKAAGTLCGGLAALWLLEVYAVLMDMFCCA
jgi:hypothetical protein